MNLPPCPRCGTPIQADWDSCQNCGLTADELAAIPPPTPESGPETPRLLAAAGKSPRPSRTAGPGQFPGADPQGPAAPMGYPGGHPGQPVPKPRTSTAAIVGMVVLGVVIVGAIAAFALVMLAGEPKDRFSEVGPAIDESPPLAATEPEWETFTAPDGRFSVELPGTPTGENDTIPVGEAEIPVVQYELREGDTLYEILYIQAVDGLYIASPQGMLEDMVSSIETGIGAPVTAEYFDFVGNSAVEGQISFDGGVTYLFGLGAGDRSYLLAVGAPGTGNPDAFDRMKNSLQLLG